MKVCPKCGGQYDDDANFCTIDAGRLSPMVTDAVAAIPSAAPAGSRDILGGRFQVGMRIGGAETGAVHRAVDLQSGIAVAIKLVAPSVVAQPAVAQRVERELKLLEKVEHPTVARVLSSGRDGDQIWFAMEWLEGATTLTALVPAGGVGPQRASDLAASIGGALVDAAKVGVVHRDLSPKNVLIAGGAVKLINFAVPVPGDVIAGAPSFVSPEAIEGKAIDQRSATYSLGAMYYYLLTGEPPFIGNAQAIHAAHLAGTAAVPSQRAAVSADIDSLVRRAMERKPTQRFLTLRQFVDDIEKVNKVPEGGANLAAPFGKAGKAPKEMIHTMLGLGPIPGNEMPTQQMAVQIPPEAMRESPPASPGGPKADAGVSKVPLGSPTLKQMSAVGVGVDPSAIQSPAISTQPGYHAVPVPGPIAVDIPASAPQAGGSPWAAPSGYPVLSPVAAPVAQVPMAQAPVAQPYSPPPGASGSSGPAGGKKKPEMREKRASKGKFRETMWFKKGDLDAAAADAAATDKEGAAPDKADLMPIEERYGDDGSITSSDAARYSLKTGHTSAMPAMQQEPARAGSVSERELISEMKGGRKKILVLIVAGIFAAIAIGIGFASM